VSGQVVRSQVLGPRTFEVLGVIDLRRGLAVRAHGGQRERYRPIEHVAGEPIPPGHAGALARRYVERFGLARLYVADLDAIEHCAFHPVPLDAIASSGAPIWLDSGIASVAEAEFAFDRGAERVIVGLETLPSFSVLESIAEAVDGDRVVFSLDLRDGAPVTTAQELARQPPEDLVARAADAGVAAVIALDLARVGARSGLDLELLARIRLAAGSVGLYAGGGVRSPHDLESARSVGCDGALVASALLDGHITARDLGLNLEPRT
jgi:phosphoribosylformimino-5-aminoimidazole carboxamide ribotide isomerase